MLSHSFCCNFSTIFISKLTLTHNNFFLCSTGLSRNVLSPPRSSRRSFPKIWLLTSIGLLVLRWFVSFIEYSYKILPFSYHPNSFIFWMTLTSFHSIPLLTCSDPTPISFHSSKFTKPGNILKLEVGLLSSISVQTSFPHYICPNTRTYIHVYMFI